MHSPCTPQALTMHLACACTPHLPRQVALAEDYLGQFGGPVADKKGAKLRQATATDLHEVFAGQDKAMSGYMDVKQLNAASIQVRHSLDSLHSLTATGTLHPHPNRTSHPNPASHPNPTSQPNRTSHPNPTSQPNRTSRPIQMGFPFRNDKDLKSTFSEIDTNGKGRISELEFVEWWNKVSSK